MKNVKLEALVERAMSRLGTLASELVRVESSEKEIVLAEIEFQGFMTESCLDCQGGW